MWGIVEPLQSILKAVLSMPNTSTQHNSSYVVFSDSGKSLVTSPLLEVWARTRQRNICAEIPVSRSITSRSERVQRHNAQSDGGQSTETVSERVPTRWTKNEPRKKSAISFKDFKRVYSIQIQAFLGVFCVRYIIYTPYAFTTPYRATESHYNAFWKQNYKSCCILW